MGCRKKVYAIRKASELTGVKPVTLRAWQRRYNLIQPQRTEKGHRLYCDEDISRIKSIQNWLIKGVPIGKVKGLLEADVTPGDTLSSETGQLEDVDALLEALASLRKTKAESIINTVLKEYPLDVVEVQFVDPVQRAQSVVKRPLRTLQEGLFNSLMVARLESIIEAENKAARMGRCLFLSYENNRDIHCRIWALRLSDQGWNLAIIDAADDVSGLYGLDVSSSYSAIALYSRRPATKLQKTAIEKLSKSYPGQLILSEVLEATRA